MRGAVEELDQESSKMPKERKETKFFKRNLTRLFLKAQKFG
jgi:hypothetical protein